MPNFNLFKQWRETDIKEYKERFKQNRFLLFNALDNSASRKGVMTGTQGLATVAPSDHLPITLNFKGIKLCSWNLLADQHLDNCFMNVTRKTYFNELFPIKMRVQWNSILKTLGKYILEHSKQSDGKLQVQITSELLQNLVIRQEQHGEKDAAEVFRKMLSVLLDHNNPNHHEFAVILKYIVEIAYYLNHGDLLWEKRLKLIQHNQALVESLSAHDILCLQECTNPQDILRLLQEQITDRNFAMLVYKIDEKSSDHCVIIYDQNKFTILEQINFGLQFDQSKKKFRKPAIMAKFSQSYNETNLPIVIGSIHHPAGKESELSEIIKQAEQLSINIHEQTYLDVIVLGDYNNKSQFFSFELIYTNYSIKMSKRATMAGPEYGNFNTPIDGALTNQPGYLHVEVLNKLKFSENIELPLNIEMALITNDFNKIPILSS